MKINDWLVENDTVMWRNGDVIISVKQQPDALNLQQLSIEAAQRHNHRIISHNPDNAAGPGIFICLERAGVPVSIHRLKDSPEAPEDPRSFAEHYDPVQVFQVLIQ